MAERIPCPPPGIYPDIPSEVYHSWAAASNSTLGRLAQSPLHCRYYLDTPQERTPATVRGDALHSAVLEPQTFAERYVVSGPCVAALKSGDRKGEGCGAPGRFVNGGTWQCGKHGYAPSEDPRQVLTAADHADCMGMARAVREHPIAAYLLAATAEREVSAVFTWPGTDVMCKARFDVPAWEAGIIGDLKTKADDVSAPSFARSIASFGYYRQAAFYRAAALAHGHAVENFVFVAVEACAPYGVAVYDLDPFSIEVGERELDALVEVWQRCTEFKSWPGYASGVQTISLPEWKLRQLIE